MVKGVLTVLVCTLCLYLVINASGCNYVGPSAFRLPPGQRAPTVPRQTAVNGTEAWEHRGYKFRPLAAYSITARVIMTARHGILRDSKFAPFDLTVGWGEVSDTALLKHYSFMHGYRWVFPRASNPPISWEHFGQQMANMHLIAASEEVERKIGRARTDDVVTMKGFLVSIEAEDGWSRGSSLSREDSGNGACEVMWVDSFSYS